jgi:hypothetical protein
MIKLLLALILLPCVAFAAPSVTGVSGSSTLTIAGSGFGTKATAAPKYFNKFETETIGEIPADQSYGLAGGKPYSLLTISDTSRTNGTKTISYRYNTSSSEIFGRNYIDLGAQDNIYATMWVKISKTGTTSTGWNWKGEYISSNQLDYNGNAPHTTITKVNFWDEAQQRWYNPSYFSSPSNTWPNNPSGLHTFDTWERMEYWIKRNSGSGVADGTIYINRIGLSNPVVNTTTAITHDGTYTEQWRYLNIGQGITNNYDGTVDITISYDDVYADTTPQRVEMCDSSTWSTRTHCEIQPTTTWSDTSITAIFNQGSFSTGATVYYYVVDSTGAVSPASDPYTIGGGGQTLPTTTLSIPGGNHKTSKSITLSTTGTSATYCKSTSTNCTPVTNYSVPVKVLINISYEKLCYKSTDGTNDEAVKCEEYRKRKQR